MEFNPNGSYRLSICVDKSVFTTIETAQCDVQFYLVNSLLSKCLGTFTLGPPISTLSSSNGVSSLPTPAVGPTGATAATVAAGHPQLFGLNSAQLQQQQQQQHHQQLQQHSAMSQLIAAGYQRKTSVRGMRGGRSRARITQNRRYTHHAARSRHVSNTNNSFPVISSQEAASVQALVETEQPIENVSTASNVTGTNRNKPANTSTSAPSAGDNATTTPINIISDDEDFEIQEINSNLNLAATSKSGSKCDAVTDSQSSPAKIRKVQTIQTCSSSQSAIENRSPIVSRNEPIALALTEVAPSANVESPNRNSPSRQLTFQTPTEANSDAQDFYTPNIKCQPIERMEPPHSSLHDHQDILDPVGLGMQERESIFLDSAQAASSFDVNPSSSTPTPRWFDDQQPTDLRMSSKLQWEEEEVYEENLDNRAVLDHSLKLEMDQIHSPFQQVTSQGNDDANGEIQVEAPGVRTQLVPPFDPQSSMNGGAVDLISPSGAIFSSPPLTGSSSQFSPMTYTTREQQSPIAASVHTPEVARMSSHDWTTTPIVSDTVSSSNTANVAAKDLKNCELCDFRTPSEKRLKLHYAYTHNLGPK